MGDFTSSRTIVRFGEFELDQDAGELRRDGAKVRLQEQPLQVLQILLENPGKIIPREQLQRRIWPSDTFVDFDHGINNAVKRLREALGDTAETPRYVETVPRRGYRFIGSTELRKKATSGQIQSLAVLPLENLSHDPEQEYFAEGMTEALIAALAKISALKVTSRTTVVCYTGKRQPLRTIAAELGVHAIVEGTVLRSEQRVRISVQLIEAATDCHIWAETYERELRDVLTLQSEVARAIAREIQVKLTPKERTFLGKTQAVDPEAYEAYLKGRYHWNRRSGDGLERANRYFQQAVTKDPNYAAAYAGLADCANIAGWYGFASPKEGSGKGKELALGALAMDDSLAEAHCSLAWGLLHYDFNFPEAELEFHRSLELDPLNATTVLWYAVYLSAIGHCDQSTTESVRAVHLDPLSPRVMTVAGMQFFVARRYDEAIEMCRKALELDPGFSFARWTIAGCLIEQENPAGAIAEMDEVVRNTGRVPIHLYMLAHSHARSGSRERALRLVQELQELSQNHYISPIWLAVIYTSLNEKDEAFRWLDCAYQERACWMVYMKSWPWSDNLRSDPRFDDLVRRMNYPE